MSDTGVVRYCLERTGRTEHEVAEKLLTSHCPSCGALWAGTRTATPRHSGSREFRCEACGEHHKAQQVDGQGRPVMVPGWNLRRQLEDDEEGPGRHLG